MTAETMGPFIIDKPNEIYFHVVIALNKMLHPREEKKLEASKNAKAPVIWKFVKEYNNYVFQNLQRFLRILRLAVDEIRFFSQNQIFKFWCPSDAARDI